MSDNNSNSGLSTASLVLGIIAFFLNPLYICSILAIIFGSVSKNKTGLILGIISLVLQFLLDIIITVFSLGMGAFTFCC